MGERCQACWSDSVIDHKGNSRKGENERTGLCGENLGSNYFVSTTPLVPSELLVPTNGTQNHNALENFELLSTVALVELRASPVTLVYNAGT